MALKIDSPDISHKSDVPGVALNVTSATQVRDVCNDRLQAVRRAQPAALINGVTIQPMSGLHHGREIYIGMATDDPFGPVITFGAGGTMIELPPRMLARYTLIDCDREMARVAVHRTRESAGDGEFTETERITGVSRSITNPDQTSAEYSREAPTSSWSARCCERRCPA